MLGNLHVTGALALAHAMVHAALRSDVIPAELGLGKAWGHFDIKETKTRRGRGYEFKIFIPAAASVVKVVTSSWRNVESPWGWDPSICSVTLTDSDDLWVFGCKVIDNDIVAHGMRQR